MAIPVSGVLGESLVLSDLGTLSLLNLSDALASDQVAPHLLMASLTIIIGGSNRALGTTTRFTH